MFIGTWALILPINIIFSFNKKSDKTWLLRKWTATYARIRMEGGIVKMLGVPQLILSIHIVDWLSSFVIVDNPRGTIQWFLGSENILTKKQKKSW